MAEQRMDQKNLDIYGHPPIPWSRALAELEDMSTPKTYWLATSDSVGQPHIAAIGALWVDGMLYFTSGAGTRKSRSLAGNPHCSISVSLATLDLVFEGVASRTTDQATLEDAAARYSALGWPATATGDAITAPFSAPSAGPAPWNLYVITPEVAFGVATKEPHGASRWRFTS